MFIALAIPFVVSAQVEIVKDHRLDLLRAKQEELNKKVYMDNNRTGAGYRILVISTNDRKQAIDVKTRLMRDFPEQKTYLIYQSPHFKIHIGNFRLRQDADALRKQITKIYPTGVIIIPSTVEMRPEDDLQMN
jgi:hypothetical protein